MKRLTAVTTRLTAGVLPALALGACSLAPKYVAPAPPVPASWPVGDAYLAQSEASLPLVSYKEVFRDPRLQSLVEQALTNNRDLRVAAANIAAARAQVRVTRANQFPAVTATTSATDSETGGGFGQNGMNYTLRGGISSFELDLFGKLANATQSQRDTALATEASARTVRLGLVADLALGWATYAADRDLLNIAQATAANAAGSVRLSAARLKGGVAARTELRQAEQVLETANGDVASQKAQLAQDINAIRLLIGADFDQALLPAGIDEVNASLSELPAGTSTQVLLRRPDVVQAEYQLRAANADIGVARAQLFPSISLSALIGFASTSLSALFDGASRTTTLGGNGSWSIFNAGGLSANVAVTKAQRDAALATYEKAIQTAFSETADALADQGTLAERLRAASAFTAATQDAAQLTEATYRRGIASSLDNLDAQRTLYSARRTEIAVRLQQATNRVTLYRVLGGDQSTAPAQP
ncbi:efflux transporter outer membrane subunit [Novosphingobium sp. P6W]|uniref:efflux transporter outer membrane subunit n=1 Tax=Novosphingobium sp. P6W TaxID=1609758 RepID=UPI0005C2CE52|nr:efflux transporter outer membrane subunit [Novosphingobium sp. P6W]AXB76905.1 transporter [Novosphingobium sp. P6W]KIS33252.1 transporter [Novosphingobium sp. P6W]